MNPGWGQNRRWYQPAPHTEQMWTGTVKAAEETQPRGSGNGEVGVSGCNSKTKKGVLWDRGKEKHEESEKPM